MLARWRSLTAVNQNKNMIEKTQSYKVGEKLCATLEEAQIESLIPLLAEAFPPQNNTLEAEKCAKLLVQKSEQVIDILTTGPNSKPKARRINGGTKKRTPKTAPAPATT